MRERYISIIFGAQSGVSMMASIDDGKARKRKRDKGFVRFCFLAWFMNAKQIVDKSEG